MNYWQIDKDGVLNPIPPPAPEVVIYKIDGMEELLSLVKDIRDILKGEPFEK